MDRSIDLAVQHICIGDKLFRYGDFFSEKIIVGPQEGETLPSLAQMVLTQCTSISELLVHHVAPPGGQIQQYVLFSPLSESPVKKITPKYGSTVKNLTLTFLPQIFLGVPIYMEGPTFHRGTSKLTVTVTITVTVTVTGVRWTFQELTKFQKIFFFKLKL